MNTLKVLVTILYVYFHENEVNFLKIFKVKVILTDKLILNFSVPSISLLFRLCVSLEMLLKAVSHLVYLKFEYRVFMTKLPSLTSVTSILAVLKQE